MSFLNVEAQARLQNNQLLRLNSLINWKEFGKKMGDLGRSGYGPSAYDNVKMLKALILQAWHSFSDMELEEALRVRLDFMIFTDLNTVPTSTTLCHFRNLLIERGLMDDILDSLNQQLEHQGLKVKNTA
jgi:IS5 family transposase